MESVAFAIPTVTTNFAGFGDWVKNNFVVKQDAVLVLERNERDDEDAIERMRAHIRKLTELKTLIRQGRKPFKFIKNCFGPNCRLTMNKHGTLRLKK